MIRIVQIGLLLAVMVPFAWLVKSGVANLSPRWLDFLSGIPVGMLICYGLWRWDDRQRAGSNRSD